MTPLGAAAAGLSGKVRVRHALVEAHRQGRAITLLDQIPTLACLGEVEGFEAKLRVQGTRLTLEERRALEDRRRALEDRRRALDPRQRRA